MHINSQRIEHAPPNIHKGPCPTYMQESQKQSTIIHSIVRRLTLFIRVDNTTAHKVETLEPHTA